jgi:glycosyltransferase involved in cell wall biosynthesis/CDP-glycerol glycerophosphotransferase (TagB/SpsB family)
MAQKYKISVVVPIYNVEQYLAETIESVIAQTIGFEENIQLVLVNDGSPDNSEAICKEYRDKYSDNIIYVKQKNSGVSAARNNGLKKATGDFIAFLDSDDKWSPDYAENMLALLESNPTIPFVAARVKWFGAKTSYHAVDYKFTSTRVVDLNAEPNTITSLISSVMFRAEYVKGATFDTSMTHNEDAKFIDTVILKSGVYRYGLVRESELNYRKREEELSASDTAKERHSYYDSTIHYAKFLAGAGKFTKDGKIPGFLQFHSLYHYRWRFTQNKKPDILTDKEWVDYKNAILDGIRALDSETIIEGSINLSLSQKMALLHVKFAGDKKKIQKAINQDKTIRSILFDKVRFTVSTINYTKREGIIIEGTTAFSDPIVFKTSLKFFLDNDEVKYTTHNASVFMFDDKLTEKTSFRVAIPTNKQGNLCVRLVEKNGASKQLDIAYTNTSRISMRRNDYRVLKGKVLLLPFGNSLTITDFQLRKIVKREALFLAQNLLKNKYHIPRNTLKTLAVEAVRLIALINIRRKPSGVWLFSDRSISGGDNSEVLFRYVSDQRDPMIKPYYVINKDTSAYERLKNDGYNVVAFKSFKHLYLGIISEMILPSHMDMMYLFPWFGVWRKYCGLVQYDIAHTQHGIVLNDLTNYISKQKKNANIFLSACNWEQKHLTDGSYGYTMEQVPVTGLPRYDELVDGSKNKRIISLHPTWRSWLSGREKDGVRAYNDKFKESEYYQFYKKLITDKRLIKALDRNDYTLRYYIHPNHTSNRADFDVDNKRIEIMGFPHNYNQIFSESELFITDYSNTLFDFSYLRKPIIHTQFDFDTFFARHGSLTKQLFDYEKDGFGPVCYDYESAVAAIVDYLDSGVTLDKKYRKRIDNFFAYSDAKNSQRAYKFIRDRFLENRGR